MNILARTCLVATCLLFGLSPVLAAERSCKANIAQWLDPADGSAIETSALFDPAAAESIVLLGEVHDNPMHHRWQLYALSALHSRNANLVLGLEMLPRRVQPVLDDWSAGELDETTFLERSEWNEVWGYDPELYLPLLQFARQHRLPVIALNVDRQLVSKVGAEGWDSLSKAERMGLSDPAPASADYRRQLGELYAYKMSLGGHDEDASASHSTPDVDEVMQSDAFSNFVEAQLTWDRAMAEALAGAHEVDSKAIVVGIAGRGHLEYGYGIPHQLADLGVDDVAVLLPVDADTDCAGLAADLAEAVFVVEARAAETSAPRPLLGVMIESTDDGVRVMEVVADSVAAASGIREGDIIQQAAGFETATTTSLIEVIQRQAPGTWLPLTVSRDDRELELIARFPKSFQ